MPVTCERTGELTVEVKCGGTTFNYRESDGSGFGAPNLQDAATACARTARTGPPRAAREAEEIYLFVLDHEVDETFQAQIGWIKDKVRAECQARRRF
ncbi:hypothetical protein ACFL0Y_01180 [Patescibacteria group bacterium]